MKLLAALALALIAHSFPQLQAANILGLFVFPGNSHKYMYNTIVHGLLANGHQLTVVSYYHLPEDTANYTRIEITPAFDAWSYAMKHVNANVSFDLHQIVAERMIDLMHSLSLKTTEHALSHRNVQRLLHESSAHFDLVLVEEFHQEALLMFAHQFRAPLVSISTLDYSQHFNEMFGVFGAWSHVPHERALFSDRMSWWQRVWNVKISLMDYCIRHWDYMPKQQALADKYFAHLPAPRPQLEQLNRNISVLLLNRFQPTVTVQPTVPGLVDVGGLHITQTKPLPADIREFLDAAGPRGAVLFCLGTELRIGDMPAAQLNAFLRMFEHFADVSFLWKCEDAAITDRLPPNVLARPWMPQSDILADRRVRVFLTHGGQFGLQEAIHHGVAVLGIPVFSDQYHNMAMADRTGMAITLHFANVTEESLGWALQQLLDEPRFAANARRASQIFRDRPQRPLQLALYWIEYVIRYRGAGHLRSAAVDLSWLQYMLLDIVAVGVVGIVAFCVIGTVLYAKIRGAFRGKPNTAVKKNS